MKGILFPFIVFFLGGVAFAQQRLFIGRTHNTEQRHLIRRPGSEILMLVFTTWINDTPPNRVLYSESWDDGDSWAKPETVYPRPWQIPAEMRSASLGHIDVFDVINPVPAVVFDFRWPPPYYFYTWRDINGVWRPHSWVYADGYIPVGVSIVTAGDMVFVIYKVIASGQNEDDPGLILCDRFHFDNPEGTLQRDYLGPGTRPCICADGDGNIHTVCVSEDHQWLIYRKQEAGKWLPPETVNYEPMYISSTFIENYGDSVAVVWEHPASSSGPGEIYRRCRFVYMSIIGPWGDIKNVSNTSELRSEVPVQAWLDYTFYYEEREPGVFGDIRYWGRYTGSGWVCEIPGLSYNPNAQIRHSPAAPYDVLYVAWTEKCYSPVPEVWFNRMEIARGSDIAYYSVGVGERKPSYFCLKRDGFRIMRNRPVDYALDTLAYSLTLLNPSLNISYEVLNIVSPEDGGVVEEIYFDDYRCGEFAFRSNSLETLNLNIPLETYRDDRRVIMRIVKKRGSLLNRAGIILKQIERDVGKGEGQTAGLYFVSNSFLHVIPNITKGNAKIEYLLPKEEDRVAIKVYDSKGCWRKTLYYGVSSRGLNFVPADFTNLPNGSYFVVLETSDRRISQKVIVK
ncbi:MAG: hypothetical protein ABIK84_03805 [candidate division WOR-3 bacterium]